MDTATATPTPILLDKTREMHQGEGFGNGETREEKEHYEWYDNRDDTRTCTMKKISWIKTTTMHEEHTHIHKTNIETISIEEYLQIIGVG